MTYNGGPGKRYDSTDKNEMLKCTITIKITEGSSQKNNKKIVVI